MSHSLYTLTNEFSGIVAELEEYDLDPEVFQSTLDSLTLPIEQKVENIIKYMKSLESLAEAKKAEAKRLSESAASDLKKAEWFKAYMADNLTKAGIKNLDKVENNPPDELALGCDSICFVAILFSFFFLSSLYIPTIYSPDVDGFDDSLILISNIEVPCLLNISSDLDDFFDLDDAIFDKSDLFNNCDNLIKISSVFIF